MREQYIYMKQMKIIYLKLKYHGKP